MVRVKCGMGIFRKVMLVKSALSKELVYKLCFILQMELKHAFMPFIPDQKISKESFGVFNLPKKPMKLST